jgi:two-component system, NtrC family, sensor kinase
MTILPFENSQPLEKSQGNQKQNLTNLFKEFSQQLTLSQKISYGYGIAIGISVLGTITGLIIGDYYQKKAELKLNLAETQQTLFQSLNYDIEQVRSHPQQLISTMGNSIWFRYERNDFRNHIYLINDTLSNINNFVNGNPNESVISLDKFEELYKDYSLITKTYVKLINSLWDELDPPNVSKQDIPLAQEKVLMKITDQEYLKLWVEFEQLSEQLKKIIELSQVQKEQANQQLIKSNFIRFQIITGSIIISIIIAIILAIYTSKAIAKPLVNVTQIAYKVTQEKDFNLQIPILTEDEIGKLGISLNLLIKWANEYTKELELARQNLEIKVEERTQELSKTLADLKQTQSKLIQSEKMSSLGKMVAGIAHEINNPISFIYGNLDYIDNYFHSLQELISLYQQVYDNDHVKIKEKIEVIELEFIFNDLPKIINSMQKGSKRIKKIVQSLRNFSHLDESTFKQVDLCLGLEHTITMLNHKINRGIKVVKNFENLPLVNCYPAQINQVFYHIINNGIDAVSDGVSNPEIIISTSYGQGETVKISIKDNGLGIPKEIQDKLFDPFFTTKPVGKGQGLGLTICYNIIQQHRGDIKFISIPNEGTEFIITLPIKLYL